MNAALREANLYVGTSGFSYKHWAGGVFYPPKLSQRKWLEYYAEKFCTVELNNTFYRLPPPERFDSWKERTPAHFRFAVKGSQLITHRKKLNSCQEPVEEFMGRIKRLEEKLSVILWQLPPRFNADEALLRGFVQLLSSTGFERHAFEFRDPSWFAPPILKVLAEAGFPVVIADWRKCRVEENLVETSPFVYVRRHGPTGRYSSCYTTEQLAQDAEKIIRWLDEGKDVYVYFNNDYKGYAPANAIELIGLIEEKREKSV